MNTSPSSTRPALSCQLARTWHALFGGDRASASGHIARCSACQEHFAREDAFSLGLGRDARRVHATPRAGFEQSIFNAVQRSARIAPVPTVSPFARFSFVSLTATAACAAIAFVALRDSDVGPATPRTADGDLATAAVTALETSAAKLFAQVEPRADALLQKDPVRTQVDAFSADARTAVRFLALNFLPSTPVASGTGSGD